MKNDKICLICNETGREKHKFIRSDGENVEETIFCEFCNGAGCINISFYIERSEIFQ